MPVKSVFGRSNAAVFALLGLASAMCLALVAVGSCPMLLRRLLRAAQADAARPDRGPHLCSEWRMRRQSGAVAAEG